MLGLILLTGCTAPGWFGDPEDPSVVVIGDSLTYQADGNDALYEDNRLLSTALTGAGYYAHVNGWMGAQLPDGREAWDWEARLQVPDPDIVIIALGTNDMKVVDGETAVPLEEARATVREWLSVMPAEACVRFIGVNEGVWGWGLDRSGPAYNAMLAEELLVHADAAIVEWRPDMSWYPDGGADPHADDLGDAAYRDLIVSLADGCASPQDSGLVASR